MSQRFAQRLYLACAALALTDLGGMGKTIVGSNPCRRLTSKTTLVRPPPRYRLRKKTQIQRLVQIPVVGCAPEPEPAEQSQDLSPKMVYLVTLPHPKKTKSSDGYSLKAPGSLSKSEILDHLLAACECPVYLDAKNIVKLPPGAIEQDWYLQRVS